MMKYPLNLQINLNRLMNKLPWIGNSLVRHYFIYRKRLQRSGLCFLLQKFMQSYTLMMFWKIVITFENLIYSIINLSNDVYKTNIIWFCNKKIHIKLHAAKKVREDWVNQITQRTDTRCICTPSWSRGLT